MLRGTTLFVLWSPTVRSEHEMIAELEAEGSLHESVALIVAYETSALPIFSSDKARRILLHEALSLGGRPMGLIAVDRIAGESKLRIRIDASYTGASVPLVRQCLHELSLLLSESLRPSALTVTRSGSPTNYGQTEGLRAGFHRVLQ
jgi:hypothetical protein